MSAPVAWNSIEERTVVPGFHGKFVHSERMTFVLWRIDRGAILPPHRHPHEQVVHIYSGEIEMLVDGVRHVSTAGTVLVIPPDALHEGVALTDCSVMDAFAPVRDDYRGTAPFVLQGGGIRD